MTRIAVFGGLYSNYLALEAALADASRRGVEAIYCLGDLGAFGPHPDRVFPLLRDHGVLCIQGNYDNSIGNELADCQCGYTDPRDNHFAQVSYEYTLENTSSDNRRWLRELPGRDPLGARRASRAHVPRQPAADERVPLGIDDADAFPRRCGRATPGRRHPRHAHRHQVATPARGGRRFVNVGVLGRPENDGHTNVWYALLEQEGSDIVVEFVPIFYDHERLAREMAEERLPQEFVETIPTGWWTTCLEILPSKERRRGKW